MYIEHYVTPLKEETNQSVVCLPSKKVIATFSTSNSPISSVEDKLSLSITVNYREMAITVAPSGSLRVKMKKGKKSKSKKNEVNGVDHKT